MRQSNRIETDFTCDVIFCSALHVQNKLFERTLKPDIFALSDTSFSCLR